MRALAAIGVSLALAGIAGAQEIVFEDATATSGIRRERLPVGARHAVPLQDGKVDTTALKPGVLYWDWPFDVFCGDIDGDGHTDIVSADHHPSLDQQTPGGIWLGRGDGTFGPNLLERLPVDLNRRGIGGGYGVVVDVDGDRRNDVFISEAGGVFLNLAVVVKDDPFGFRFRAFPFGGWRGTIFGDFNRDGNLDVATGTDLYFGGGKGTHPAQGWTKSPQAAEVLGKWSDPLHSCIAADFRRSGAMDILAGQAVWPWAWSQKNWEEMRAKAVQPRGLLFVNDGKGNFTESAETFGLAEMSSCGPLTAADFNNDGFFDVFSVGLGNPDNPAKARLHINLGGKHFEMRDAPACGITLKPVVSGIPLQYCMSGAADLNNDGLIDLVVGDGTTHTLRIFRNLGDFRFREDKAIRFTTGGHQCRFAVADFNEDGRLDLALNGGRDGVEVYLNRSQGTGGRLDVAVKGTAGNSNGVGALIEVFESGKLGELGSLSGMRHVVAENQNHVPLEPHFGLGRETAVDLRVTLPTGKVLEAKSVKANTRVVADFVLNKVRVK